MLALARSRPLASLLVSALVFLGVLGLRISGNLESLELAAYDWHIRMRPTPPKSSPRVVLLTITENDIRQQGTWPLPDATLARVLETLTQYEPRAIGLDIYRDVPVPPGREELDRVLTSYGHIIAVMKFQHGDDLGVPPPPVFEGTEQVGFTDILVDPGGIVRRGLLFLDDGQTVSYSLALRLALLYLYAEGVTAQPDPENPEYIRFGPTTIRPFEANDGSYVDADAGGYQFLLDYRDPPGVFPSITLSDFLAGNFESALLKDKIVLVGVTAESVKDLFYTPHSRGRQAEQQTFGIALHAHSVSQLLRAGLDGDAPLAVASDIQESLWILVWTLLGGLLALAIRSAWRFAFAVAGGLVLLTFGVHWLFTLGWWIPLVPPALGWVGSAGLVMAYVSSQEKKERANLMQLFSSHISPQLATAIWEQRDEFLSGGRPRPQKLTATAFFTDIADFTTVSEGLNPQALMDWLSEFMETVTPLVNEHGGVILRFIGDSIMAVFGVPVARTTEAEIRQDAVNAVDCALAIQRRLIDHNRHLKERGQPVIGMRIGILTGPMVAGDIGGAQRLEYNVHGDTVNTASRLESYDKQGFAPDYFKRPCRILIGEATFEQLGEQFRTELVGEAKLKGKYQRIRIYRVLGRKHGGRGEPRDEQQAPSDMQAPLSRVASGSPH